MNTKVNYWVVMVVVVGILCVGCIFSIPRQELVSFLFFIMLALSCLVGTWVVARRLTPAIENLYDIALYVLRAWAYVPITTGIIACGQLLLSVLGNNIDIVALNALLLGLIFEKLVDDETTRIMDRHPAKIAFEDLLARALKKERGRIVLSQYAPIFETCLPRLLIGNKMAQSWLALDNEQQEEKMRNLLYLLWRFFSNHQANDEKQKIVELVLPKMTENSLLWLSNVHCLISKINSEFKDEQYILPVLRHIMAGCNEDVAIKKVKQSFRWKWRRVLNPIAAFCS